MSHFDAVASGIFWYFVLPAISALGLFLFLMSQMRNLRELFFAFIFCRMFDSYLAAIDEGKSHLFEDLGDFRSLNLELRNRGLLRILELGPGPGNNFRYFPRNSKVIAVEPNKNFVAELIRRARKCRNIQVERVVLGRGEDMSEVKDNYVDVVVVTLVLCSVADIDAVLREIHRVLAPGGKLYFFEHGYGTREPWQRILQSLLNPLWGLLLDGCQLDRDAHISISRSGLFQNIQTNSYELSKWVTLIKLCVGLHVYGTAEKPLL